MKVLVLGGTGAMGVHLVQLLIDNGIETVVTSRKFRHSEGKIKYIQGNAHDIQFLKTVLDECHWDTIVDFMIYKTSGFKERVNLLLSAASQYVFLSSARVYTDSEHPITESSPRLLDVSKDKEFLSTDEYSLAKAQQEDILRDSGHDNWTIIRPYITYSENRLQLGVLEKEGWLYRALHGRTIVFSSDIATKKTTLTYALDVSKRIMSIINSRSALGEAYNVTTSESKTWYEILDIYLAVLNEYLGYYPKVLLADLDMFLGCNLSKYQVIYDRLYNRQFDNSKIKQYANEQNLIKVDEGLKDCIGQFLKEVKFNNINWKSEALKDRLAKEHTPLKEIKGCKQKIKYVIFRYLKN